MGLLNFSGLSLGSGQFLPLLFLVLALAAFLGGAKLLLSWIALRRPTSLAAVKRELEDKGVSEDDPRVMQSYVFYLRMFWWGAMVCYIVCGAMVTLSIMFS